MLRASPSSNSLRDAFRLQTGRLQRHSDGTNSVEQARINLNKSEDFSVDADRLGHVHPGRYGLFRKLPR